jgi:mono/diheme cytochrome c family protein
MSMKSCLLIVLVFAVSAASPRPSPRKATDITRQDVPSQAPAAEAKIPEEAAKKANPVKPTPAGLAQAKKLYGYDCAMCHGKGGDGQGDLAGDMKLKLNDWRDSAALKDTTDGELFYIISKGRGQMPAGEQQMKPDEIWMMVNYVRSFATKTKP